MSEWDKLRRKAQVYKELYPAGSRIVLNHMEDPWAPVPAGTRGTVVAVDDIGKLHMQWDNGRTLALVPGEDSFRKLTQEEILEEQQSLEDKLTDAIIASKQSNVEGMPEKNDWTFYNGAWIYPIEGGWEANLNGFHYDDVSLEMLKGKIDRAIEYFSEIDK